MEYRRYFEDVQSVIVTLLIYALVIFALFTTAWRASPGERAEIGQEEYLAAEAAATTSGLFGNISISSQDQVSLAYAYLLVNGERYGNLADGALAVRVYPGDIISIDGSAYHRALTFQIKVISSSIDSAYLREAVTTDGDAAQAGTVVFR